MHRLFVAIRPPLIIRSQLLALMEGVAGARWQKDDQLHLTLRFIGEVDGHVADDLAGLLGTVRFQPFSIALAGVGRFEKNGRTDALWAGVHPREALSALHRKIDHLCVTMGLHPERRAYLPHITLARGGRSMAPPGLFMENHASLASAPFQVDGFSLYESHLGREGAIYDPIAHYSAWNK
ncbi:RNA 2',3'-cyclic phosphodiesterase [Sphingobium cloacae]|nr:RNA 2',3'-cyclic phosphodiesterase [Sphingobium cloacae]